MRCDDEGDSDEVDDDDVEYVHLDERWVPTHGRLDRTASHEGLGAGGGESCDKNYDQAFRMELNNCGT